MDENQPPEQAAYRKGYSTMDHLPAINQIQEKCDKYQIPLFMTFVVYEKAFDSVSQGTVVKGLQKSWSTKIVYQHNDKRVHRQHSANQNRQTEYLN